MYSTLLEMCIFLYTQSSTHSPVRVFRVLNFVFFTWQHHDGVIHPVDNCPVKNEWKNDVFSLLNKVGKIYDRKTIDLSI